MDPRDREDIFGIMEKKMDYVWIYGQVVYRDYIQVILGLY